MTDTPVATALPDPEAGRFTADPWADAAVAQIMGDWPAPRPLLQAAEGVQGAAAVAAQWAGHWVRLREVTTDFARWTSNGAVQQWTPPQRGMVAPVQGALEHYLIASHDMPDWADPAKIARAEALFMDNGVLSVTLLFCASLPECYVLPDLSAVLNTTGQLVDHTDYRIRQTGAMIFPVMNEGGLCTAEGLGIAQVLKVRLIHATIRNLILRQDPAKALVALQSAPGAENAGIVPAIAGLEATQDMHQRLFGMGWNLPERGLPCNQEELAYTLLTFNYVYLRGLRTLGIGYDKADEEAFLHAWNVAAHFLGVQKEWMAWDMESAKAMFDACQARGRARIAERKRANPAEPDPRPALGNALMNAMETVIPWKVFKPFPVLLTRHLCGPEMAKDLGIDGRVPVASEVLFIVVMATIRVIDTVVGAVAPGFAISRWVSRKLGAPLTYELMMTQTRSLKMPEHLRGHIQAVLNRWSAR
ncbi:MAG: DUF2236 domain-containing protein [Betaproteobacteria bacterium]|nr:DUF2236 domain-containing protein [Betaproteobacteria bacterium]